MKMLDVPQSGSVAGVTSSRNRYGQYKRTRAMPTNPSSSFQTTARSRLQLVSDAWKSLTSTQRQGWNDMGLGIVRYDSLGQAQTMTGFGAFVSVNLNNLNAGNVVVSDPPAYAPPAPITTVTPTVTSSSFSLAYTVTPLAAGERLFVSASPNRSAGRSYESDLRLISVTAAAAASPANVLAAYQARFGNPVTGSRIFISVQRYSGGFLSQPVFTSAIVA